ncbi:MAG TPA: TetR/AcrR family transcriptional regulator [Bryobacteraceae bacterium]|nr:TetR/AcrR family transcriptional regulator [Bryobacteraceae bacterium]
MRGRGRPRDEEVRKRILASAADLLRERCFREISVDAIAEHAGSGKATVYRWWPHKAAVLIEAVREEVAREMPFPNTGSLEGDLRAQLRQFASLVTGRHGRIFTRFVAAALEDADVAEAFRQMWITPRRQETKAALRRYQASGDLPDHVDLDCVVEMLFGPLYYRLLFRWGPLSDEYIDRLLETAMTGLRCRSQVAPATA